MLDAKWKIFQMAAATCNFTQTAAALGMSQPNVTGQIRKLEQELGVALFIRDGRQLRLTRPGRVLLLEAESLLALSENAVRMARNAAADVLSFQLGATMTAGGYVLPPLAAEFMREHANRRIHLCIANTEEISDKLKKRFFDLALVEGAFPVADAVGRRIAAGRFAPAAVFPRRQSGAGGAGKVESAAAAAGEGVRNAVLHGPVFPGTRLPARAFGADSGAEQPRRDQVDAADRVRGHGDFGAGGAG